MAAFCACCGAEITRKVEACPVCGTPRHGMLPLEPEHHGDAAGKRPSPENAKNASRLRDS
jgi:hypothetical protein